MSDPAIKQRQIAARQRAIALLERSGHTVEIVGTGPFDIQAYLFKSIRRIHVVVDGIGSIELNKLKSTQVPEACSREIWIAVKGKQQFRINRIE